MYVKDDMQAPVVALGIVAVREDLLESVNSK